MSQENVNNSINSLTRTLIIAVFLITLVSVQQPTYAKVIYQTDFSGGLPVDWEIIDSNGLPDGKTWTSTNPGNRTSAHWTGTFMIVDSKWAGGVDMDEQLVSHSIDCSMYNHVTLNFTHFFYSKKDEIADVDVRVNGGSWQNIVQYTGRAFGGGVDLDISAIAAGYSNVQIRWHYYNANRNWYWGIDNVAVSVPGPKIHVDLLATGQNNGTSWTDAFTSLGTAISAAQSGEEIWVAQGTYGTLEMGMVVDMEGIRTYGGFPSTGEPDFNDRDFVIYETILSGDINGDDIDVSDLKDLLTEPTRADNSDHVVTVDYWVNRNDVLDGFVISGGNAASQGGGMYIEQAWDAPTIRNCSFRNNASDWQGGGLYEWYSSPVLDNCTFNRNWATECGGGMYYENLDTEIVAVLNNCKFKGNASGDFGGGLYFFNMQNAPLKLMGSIFSGNTSGKGGGVAMMLDGPPLTLMFTNCTITNNSADIGGGIWVSSLNFPLTNCILWGNTDQGGVDESAQIHVDGVPLFVSYSCIQSLDRYKGNGNIDENPRLTPDGHLRADSPCINAGDPNFTIDPDYPTDIDGEPRVMGGRIDIGADEFLDSDGDRLPDWWEIKYPAAADPNTDIDGDGITELDEYELYSSDPNRPPLHVPSEYTTIQDAINAASNGDTILVAPGTYSGIGNRDIDFGGKWVVLYASEGPSSTIIDCEGLGRAFYFHSGDTPGTIVMGFTIINGVADYGGAIYCEQSSPQIRDCVITGNTATVQGGGIYSKYSMPTLAYCTINDNDPEGVWMEYGGAQIEGSVQIYDDWIGNDLMLIGDGTIQIDPNSTLDLYNSRIRCGLAGTGTVQVDLETELIIEHNAIVDMGHETNPDLNGTIQCDGLLRVKDNVQLRNTNVIVTRASFEGDIDISNNIITAEAGSPYGQFFIEDSVTITGNDIHADGDRYMDLDPAAFEGVIANNRIYVTITEGKGNTRGGLLELRGEDERASSSCDLNTFFCKVDLNTIPDFDPNTWTLEELRLEEGAKVNLTNRFNFGNGGLSEVMYVKKLIMEPNSVLNTAFNYFYYDANDIADSAIIKNIPLLGFSLVNIAFDDENEFLTRVVHNNTSGRIHVERVSGLDPDLSGMMRMCNIKIEEDNPNPPPDKILVLYNARAKALFAKSVEEEIFITFEYLFESSDPNVELVIYLSDVPELQDPRDPGHYLEVARLYPPRAGRPGSKESGRFGTFHKSILVEHLDFIKGTRIEFELIGPDGTCIIIDNWDPQVLCDLYCRDVTGESGVTAADFLTVVGECGKIIEIDNACLDEDFSQDGYVSIDDVMATDWLASLHSDEDPLGNYCFKVPLVSGNSGAESSSGYLEQFSEITLLNGPLSFTGSLLISGKRGTTDDSMKLQDAFYAFDENGQYLDSPYDPCYPDRRLNNRFSKDPSNELYQINLEDGLIRLSDNKVVIPPGTLNLPFDDPRYNKPAQVHIGLHGGKVDGDWEGWGHPLLDVAFDIDGFAYVIPVIVSPDDPNLAPYKAAAKLQLLDIGDPPYDIIQLFDDSDFADPCNPDNPNLSGLREIEVDEQGNVYIINAHSHNESDILWTYDSNGVKRVEFSSDPNDDRYLPAPIAMHVSDSTDMLYLSSSLNDPEADSVLVYALSTIDLLSGQDPIFQTIEINGMGHVTGITEDPVTGTLWVTGFSMKNIPPDTESPTADQEPFYYPYLAEVSSGSNNVQAVDLFEVNDPNFFDLALPLSIVWTGQSLPACAQADITGNGDVDFEDFAILASQWLDLPGIPSADIALPLDNFVDIFDLAVIAEFWLQTGCD